MSTLLLLVGPPGSGKSTMAKQFVDHDTYHHSKLIYVNQDSQGKFGHMEQFRNALYDGENIIVDRMNFNKQQRHNYIEEARKMGYYVIIHVLHEAYDTCMYRMSERIDHETINDEESAKNALNFFFRNYERVEDWEADEVHRHWPEQHKEDVIISDLDGTLADCSHRLHFVRVSNGEKKDWRSFFAGIPNDKLNTWCASLLKEMSRNYKIVYCSGRSENERTMTEDWLAKNDVRNFTDYHWDEPYKAPLYMRLAGDSRRDDIVKEIILDFEILTRYRPLFIIDDRKTVVEMWRKRGFTCLQCAKGDF